LLIIEFQSSSRKDEDFRFAWYEFLTAMERVNGGKPMVPVRVMVIYDAHCDRRPGPSVLDWQGMRFEFEKHVMTDAIDPEKVYGEIRWLLDNRDWSKIPQDFLDELVTELCLAVFAMPRDTSEEKLEMYMETANLLRQQADDQTGETRLHRPVPKSNRLPLMYLVSAFPRSEAGKRYNTVVDKEDAMELAKMLDKMVDGKLYEWARDEGMEKGMEKGMETGMETGREKGREKIILNMAALGSSAEVISKMTGCDLSKVNSILCKQN
jgi:hypothetical protein